MYIGDEIALMQAINNAVSSFSSFMNVRCFGVELRIIVDENGFVNVEKLTDL